MDAAAKLTAILELAERLGVEVREVHLGGSAGGLVRVRDKRVLFVDLDADRSTRYTACLRGLAQLPELDEIHMLPEIREDLSAAKQSSAER